MRLWPLLMWNIYYDQLPCAAVPWKFFFTFDYFLCKGLASSRHNLQFWSIYRLDRNEKRVLVSSKFIISRIKCTGNFHLSFYMVETFPLFQITILHCDLLHDVSLQVRSCIKYAWHWVLFRCNSLPWAQSSSFTWMYGGKLNITMHIKFCRFL